GVGRGYLNRPELTAERFIRNPIPELPTERLYKTGDLVCLLPDGNLQFLGRVDHQVKIRGFRIELGEIESVLQSHAEVRDAVVTAREDVPGQKRLVAYVVPRPGVSPAVSDLLAYVRGKLPAYMVPAAFMTLSELPMTPSGKVDRRALPKPGNQRPALAEEFVAPRNATEELLGGIWCEVLGVDQVGVHDSFFDLGGHSLLATQLLGRVSDAFKAEVSLACLFSAPTISSLAETLGQAAGHSAVLHLATRNKVRQAPLSLSQKRIWFLDQFDPKQSPYNMPLGVRLSGKLDRRALEQSLSHVARRHEALRSVFPAQEGQPVQWVLEPGEVTVQLVDLKHLPPGERAESAKALAAEEARKPHVLHHPMMRAVLFNVSSSEHWLVLILHEIAADAESIRLVFQELLSCYASFVEKGCAAELPSVADNEELNGAQVDCSAKEYERGMRYWKQQLTGAPPVLELPADYPRPALWADAGGRVPVRLPVELCAGVKRVSAAQGCDASTVLLAAFQALLARYTGVEDVVVGSKLSCRSNPLLKTVVGRYSNQVALRANLADAPSFCELVNRAKTRVQEAIEHVGVPFGEIVETLHPERDLSRTPIFQVFFEFDENPVRTAKAVGVEFRPIEIGNHTAKFDLTLHLEYRDGQISGWFEYSTSLFHVDRIERMARHFERLLGGALEEPETRLWDLPLLPEQEAARMLMDWNRTERPLPAGQTLVDLMAEQTRRSADRVAVVDGTQRLTYGQLCARAAVIAGALRAQGVGNQMRAGICLERSWEMLASILGTLRAGAAYVPMDPAYPAERLGYMARDAGLRVVITSRRVKATLPDVEAKVLYIEDIQWDRPAVAPMDLEDPKPKPTDLAYVIYTSGSTGDPKGVAIEHRNAVALMEWARGQFDKEELSGVLASTSICFDLSVFEMFAPLCWGGKIILALNVLALPGLPAAQEVRLVNTVPSALRELLRIRGVPAGVCTINLAGEPLASSLVDQIYGETAVRKVYDLYGPTETTTYSTGTLRRAGEPANIGRPLPNEKVYVLGMGLQPVPIGNPGELYIGGAGVARGYLNRAELTAEKFVPNPFIAGERLYKTGDLVRWRADGVLEYLGRIDHQVKIRGFRIEPGEIQFVLRNHSALSDAVVVPWTAQGDTRLIAYLELKEGVQVEAEAIRNWLSNYLPGYMVPAEFIFLDALPLTPNGKIDRKRLPPPEAVREESGRPCVPPRNAIEERLVEIWKEVLGLQRVSVQDKFFDLGGHSLLAVRMIARIRDVFKVELPLYGVFEAATIENLALGLSERRWSPEQQLVLPLTPRPEGSEVPPSFVQERLWFLDQLQPGSDAYNMPATLRLQGALHVDALGEALNQVVRRHEALRTRLHYEDGRLAQVIVPELRVELPVEDFSSVENVPQATEEWLKAETRRPFDLERGPLLRAKLLKLSGREHILSVSMHHCVSDGWSLTIFFQELELFYNALAEGLPHSKLPPLPIQYGDFARWQRQWMQGSTLDAELAYWTQRLAGAPTETDLPTDHEPGEREAAPAGYETTQLSPETMRRLMALVQRERVTPFIVLMAGLALTLHKWTGQKDQVLGTVVAGRTRQELEPVIGCFMNFLPVRVRLQGNETRRHLLEKVRATVVEAQSHQDCPFEKMVEALNPERGRGQNPLYNVALLLQNYPNEYFQGDGLQASWIQTRWHAPLLDLRFEAEATSDGFSLLCEYRTDLFDRETIQALVASYQAVLEQLTDESDGPATQVTVRPDLLSQAKRSRSRKEKQTIGIAATFTVEPVEEALRYWMNELEIPASMQFAPYNQVFQELLDPRSLMSGNSRGLNVICIRLQDWAGAAEGDLDKAFRDSIERNVTEFIRSIKEASLRHPVPWLVVFCPGSLLVSGEPQHAELLEFTEQRVASELESVAGVQVVASRQLLDRYPVAEIEDASAEELGHVPFTPVFYTALATEIARRFHLLLRPPRKVIVLDCDHTLWSGVCGEDGPAGIRVDGPWREMQEFMRQQQEAGRLLCLCSKNNEQDVEEVLARRSDMPLRREHFAGVRLNWQPKSENLKSLAQELQLGLDSFIFVDDNPVECAEVEANCPEVLTLQLPENPERISQFLSHCWAFDQLKVTSEDRNRSRFYRENQERDKLRTQSMSLAEFIKGLELRIEMDSLDADHLARAAQLTQRTNQFNFTTRRRTESELRELRETSDVLTVKVADRF
ncbi:MAG TPA: amino acid adenylation domain-containing protein, partial [Clostridia bacterium]|nr:amino acid adenylation domain-containing protein [Clostridia bacterium]